MLEKASSKLFSLINEILAFHLGNPMASPCDFLPSNTDKLRWPGDLGTDIHLNDKEVPLDDNFFNKN